VAWRRMNRSRLTVFPSRATIRPFLVEPFVGSSRSMRFAPAPW